MRNRLHDRWPIVLAPLLFFAAGLSLTYGGQPPRAERTAETVKEGNPIAAKALTSGIGAEIAFVALWVLIIAAPTLLLPRLVAIAWSYGWAFGHAATTWGWLAYPFGYGLGYWVLYWYCPLVAVVFVGVGYWMFGRHRDAPAVGTVA